jgi:hypothetical protein
LALLLIYQNFPIINVRRPGYHPKRSTRLRLCKAVKTRPTAGNTTPLDDKQKAKNIPQTAAYNTLRTMIAAYQRTIDCSIDGK